MINWNGVNLMIDNAKQSVVKQIEANKAKPTIWTWVAGGLMVAGIFLILKRGK